MSIIRFIQNGLRYTNLSSRIFGLNPSSNFMKIDQKREFASMAHTYKRVVGHKMEIRSGKKSKKKAFSVPKIPMHPLFDQTANMNLFVSYRDLKLRWKKSTRLARNTVHVARKWRPSNAVRPIPKPTSTFISHAMLPHHKPQPPAETVLGGNPSALSFAVFKSSPYHQHKVTVGDVVQAERIKRREAGEKIIFGTVLMVGTRNFTAIGKPTIQNARVHCTVEQQTICRDLLVFKFRPRKRQSHFRRHRQWVTMLRVDKIEWISPEGQSEINRHKKPAAMLDLFANRWLDEKELQLTNAAENEKLFDSSTENAPGFHQRSCLSEEYRFAPDPLGPDVYIRSD